MSIDQNNFRNELSLAFIRLLDSKRGVATQLAEAIGKEPSFVSQVKRGRPVNAMHLKAVGIVFGPEKILELMAFESKKNESIDQKALNKSGNRKKADKENVIRIITEHQDLIKRFKNPEKGLVNNLRLIDIEKVSQRLYDKMTNDIQKVHETAMILKEDLKGAEDQKKEPIDEKQSIKKQANGD